MVTVVACISDVAAGLCIRKIPNRTDSFPTRQHGVRIASHRCALACSLRRGETRVLPAPRPASAGGLAPTGSTPPLAAVPFARRAGFALPAYVAVALAEIRRDSELQDTTSKLLAIPDPPRRPSSGFNFGGISTASSALAKCSRHRPLPIRHLRHGNGRARRVRGAVAGAGDLPHARAAAAVLVTCAGAGGAAIRRARGALSARGRARPKGCCPLLALERAQAEGRR